MKSFEQVKNSFQIGNATTQLELSYVAMLLDVLAAQQTALEAIVTDLGYDATEELIALTTAASDNPFAEVLSRLSAYKGTPAYTHLATLLHESAQSFGR